MGLEKRLEVEEIKGLIIREEKEIYESIKDSCESDISRLRELTKELHSIEEYHKRLSLIESNYEYSKKALEAILGKGELSSELMGRIENFNIEFMDDGDTIKKMYEKITSHYVSMNFPEEYINAVFDICYKYGSFNSRKTDLSFYALGWVYGEFGAEGAKLTRDYIFGVDCKGDLAEDYFEKCITRLVMKATNYRNYNGEGYTDKKSRLELIRGYVLMHKSSSSDLGKD